MQGCVVVDVEFLKNLPEKLSDHLLELFLKLAENLGQEEVSEFRK